ncbi:MAG: endonuclease [Nocardioidaceae bacterium]|nr:endonuclease [Nocardioidaceae bacterium]
MPEGHTLHRLATELSGTFGGQLVASSSPQGRFDEGAALVDGRVLLGAEAWGKHLLVGFESLAEQVHVHLGLYGSWVLGPERPVVGQVRWRLSGAAGTADLRGPTACELLDPGAVETLLARLGPDPLRRDADPERAWQRLSASRTPVAALLMDQRVLAGVGNVYRAELLFRHRVDPETPGRQLDREVWDAMWTDLVALMRTGERTGRIDTVRPEHEPEAMGREPRVDDHGGEVYVYRRTDLPCLVCGTPIRRRELAGRNLFWCPTCQQDG